MIAPMMENAAPSRSSRHAVEIRRPDRHPPGRLGRIVEKQPAAVIAVGVIVGLGIGWLVKRKKWSS